MTRVYDEKGNATPVTVIEVGGNAVLQVKTPESDGYSAVQIGFDDWKESRSNRPTLGHAKKAGASPKRYVREFRLPDGETVEAELELTVNQFKPGQSVDVIGKSKGKGFQGIMRRYGASGQGASHGSKTHRRTGSVGAGATPGRIWKNAQMPGHQGDRRVTVQNLTVVQVREDDNVLLISGAVPGSKGSYVVIRPAKKRPLTEEEK